MKKNIVRSIIFVIILSLLTALLGACSANNKEPEVTAEPTEEPIKTVELYQMAQDVTSLGMCYIIKTMNNKIIVIDGGEAGTSADYEPYLPSAIRAILGLGQNDYFEVEAWFLSHAHDDHILELAKMLLRYDENSNYKINNFYFSFPDIPDEWESASGEGDYSLDAMQKLRRGLMRYYKATGKFDGKDYDEYTAYNELNGAVITDEAIDNGLTIEVDGVFFDILKNWEAKDTSVNGTSVIIKMRYDTHSVLFLGDLDSNSCGRLLKKWGEETLTCEYVQMGHHGQSGPTSYFYKKINASESIRLWPTPNWVWNVYKSLDHLYTDETRTWVGLPRDYNEYLSGGYNETGRDFVVGLYENLPSDPTQVESWNEAVLNEQRIARWEKK